MEDLNAWDHLQSKLTNLPMKMNVSSCHVVFYARDTYTFGCSWGPMPCQPGRATQYRPTSHRGKERKHNNTERSQRTPKIWSATTNDQKNNKLVTLGTMPNQNQPSLCTMSFKKLITPFPSSLWTH